MTDHAEHHHTLSYTDAIERFRADKDAWFRTGQGSPVPAAERATFEGIPYYAVDEGYIVDDLALGPYAGDEPVHFEIPTTDGQLRPAERAGVFRFELAGAAHTLTAYRLAAAGAGAKAPSPEAARSLFVPFLDSTSGTETYGAGRYLDIEPEEDGTWTLDFNLAYHPSCVYDARFSCPLTPAENRLAIRVEAGERLGAGGH